MKNYPTYYRKASTCIKRESPTTGKQVDIPEQCRIHSVGFQFLSTHDKMEFDELVKGMEAVTFEIYERYLLILHELGRRQPAVFREAHDYTPEFSGSSIRRPI